MARTLLPLILLVAAYVLHAGLTGPGGGFQAGAVLGAGGVLWTLADRRALRLGEWWWARVGLAAAVAVLLFALLAPAVGGRSLYEFARGTAHGWSIVLETAIAVSVGLTLTALFMGGLKELHESEET